MKILVSGCSLTSGHGFNNQTINKNWPNQVANNFNATLKNVGVSGYDNTGIFINFLQSFEEEDFDICLIQLTHINRIVLSPNWNGPRLCTTTNLSNGLLSDDEYLAWYKNFILLNQWSEHWQRLLKIISIVQNLVKRGKYIRFVNGLLNWDPELFSNPKKSKFLNNLIDVNCVSNHDVLQLQNFVYNQTKEIDLNLWINPFNTFTNLQVDKMSSEDSHPGFKSHVIYANLITNYLNQTL